MGKIGLLSTSTAAALLVACAALLIALEKPADAAFPGENGRIVFADGSSGGLKLIRPDGSGLTTLVNGCCEATPAVSPGGTRVAYASGYGRDQEIRTINIRTHTVRRITNNDVRDGNPAWSPDGARVAFERERIVDGARDTDIYVARTDGTGRTRNLTGTKNSVEMAPAWSPDGKEIAFHTAPSVRRSSWQCVDVLVMNLATGQRRNLTNDGTEPGDCTPNWSPDGARIVFQSEGDIYTMDASDGSDERLLADGYETEWDSGVDFVSPTYSPSGTKIAYVRSFWDYWSTSYGTMTLSKMDASDGSDKQAIRRVSWNEWDHPNKGLYDPDWGVKP